MPTLLCLILFSINFSSLIYLFASQSASIWVGQKDKGRLNLKKLKMNQLEKYVYHGTYFEFLFARGSIVKHAYYKHICFENNNKICLKMQNPIIPGESLKFVLYSNTQIDMMKAKASLRGVSTPLIGIANFLRYRIFFCLKSSFPIWGVLILLTKQGINNMKDASGQLGHILLACLCLNSNCVVDMFLFI